MTTGSVIDIYTVDLSATRAQHDRRSRKLSKAEQSRAARFKFERDRVRWTSSRAALRAILAGYLHMLPKDVTFRRRSGGKPVIDISIGDSDVTKSLTFNLSHSGDRALIVVSDSLEVGCDIEHTKRIRDWPAVARRFFSPAEQQELAGVNAGHQSLAFFLCWTRKEAVIKATGEGLRADLLAFDVSLTPGTTPSVRNNRRPDHSDSNWHLHCVRPDDDYVGAVAVRSHRTPHFSDTVNWAFDDESE